jgi:tetratricopeptide (TPR) repeat protein
MRKGSAFAAPFHAIRGAASAVPLLAALLFGALGLGCVDAPTEHRVRANAFLRGGDAAAALHEIDLGLARRKDDPGLLILRGKALFELDRMGESRDAFARAMEAGKAAKEADRTLAEAHLGLAMVGSRTKDWVAARTHFEALAGFNDKDATSHLNVARACVELHDTECALSHGETAGKLRGNDESVLYTLGNIYLNAGKLKEAELTFQHICEVAPGASSCPYGKALVAARSGDKPGALAQLRDAVSRKVPNPESIATEPSFASIKEDPEFIELVGKAGQAKN